MSSNAEHRYEQRLPYRWPVWFGRDTTEAVFSGLMVDVSSGGMAFSYKAGQCRLQEGESLTVRFSLPRFDENDPGATVGLTRTGFIRWIVAGDDGTCKIGFQFDTPLSLKPAEEAALASLCCGGTP